jgi:hypothetical protein
MHAVCFHSFCHRPDDGSLKLKRVEGVCVGCDCTIDNSEIYFSMYIPTGMFNVKVLTLFRNITVHSERSF